MTSTTFASTTRIRLPLIPSPALQRHRWAAAGTWPATAQGQSAPAAAKTRTGPPMRYHSVKEADWPTALEVPLGFTVEEVAAGLTSPRFMALDSDGSLVFGSHTAGKVV